MHHFLSGPLNANELLQKAGFQEPVRVSSCDYAGTKKTETVHPLMLKQIQSKMERLKKKWKKCRMQQDISEWLVDEFMLLMWS